MPTWKKVVVSGSAISQLNNDANYLATLGDSVLSSSAQIAADISGSFNSASTVFETRIAAQEAFSSSLDAEFLSESELVPLNTHTGSANTRLNTIEAATSSYATKLGLGLVSASAEGSTQGTISLNGVEVNVGGIATGDSPQFSTLEVGNASDTTISRAAAGQIAVEGNNLLRANVDNVLSGSAQIAADISGSLSAAAIVDLGANIVSSSDQVFAGSGLVSASAEGDAQGQIKLNGVNVNINGLQTDDNVTFADATITGNLTVSGTTTTVNSETLNIDDNIIALNGNAAALGGIAVNDGPATGSLLWDGDNDRWIAGATGSESAVLTALGYGVISGSSIGSSAQGEVALTTNGVAAAAINLGLQTSDSPQFAGIEVGNASDTTLTRAAAGQLAVEGNNLLRADVDNVMSGSAQTVENLVNQDVDLGTGDITAVSASFDYVGDADTIYTGSFRGDGSSLTGITSVSEGAIQDLGVGIVSSSQGIVNFGANIVSSSAQTIANVAAGGAGIVSSSQGVADLGANIVSASAQTIAHLASSGVVSASAEGTTQGTIALNGVEVNVGGIATGDSPQFAGIEVGNASDTTITRAGAGQIAVEGNNLLRADGDGVISSSAQIGNGIVSASAITSGDAQGQIKVNGVNVDVNGLQTDDDVTFANTTITGNLTVSGTTTTVNSETLNIDDNIIALNGNAAALGGIAVNDGPATGSLLWDGDNDRWIAGATGSESAVLTALGYGVLSGSAQIAADISGSLSAAAIVALGANIVSSSAQVTQGSGFVSASAEGDAQGQIKLNGVNVDVAGMQTDDNPQFATLEVGNASDTTLSRNAAGQLAVEGNPLLRANVDNVMSGSAQTVENLVNQDVDLGTGDITAVSGAFDYVGDKDTILTGSFRGDGSGLTGVVADGTLSSSAQIADDISGSLSAAAIVDLGANIVSSSAQTIANVAAGGAGIVSGSTLVSASQGTLTHTINGVATTVPLGVNASDSPTFANLTITGDLTVTGDRVEQQVTNLAVEDQFILINSGASAQDAGLVFDGTGASFGWDESEGRFAFDRAGSTANQTTMTPDAYIAAVAVSDSDANYQKDGNIFVSASGDAFIYVS